MNKHIKKSNRKRFFLTLFPSGEFLLASNSILEVARGQGLRPSHISECLNHPDVHYSHRGYKFIWIDRRIKKKETAYRHAVKYLEVI